MPYSQFNLEELEKEFQLESQYNTPLFVHVPDTKVSNYLNMTIKNFSPLALAINTQKSRSEWIVAPVLAEIRQLLNQQVSLFSGLEINSDPDKGLEGMIDYILCKSQKQYYLSPPILAVVEGRKDSIHDSEALGQCVAKMLGARLYNEKEGVTNQSIYGVLTNGTNWKFLKLEDNIISIDIDEYYLVNVSKIISIFLFIAKQEQQES